MSTPTLARHKGFGGIVEYDVAAAHFHGEVLLGRDVVTFQSATEDGLQHAMAASIDDYLDFCCQRGETPSAPRRAIK